MVGIGSFPCRGSDGRVYTVMGHPNSLGAARVMMHSEKVRAGARYQLDTGQDVIHMEDDRYRLVGSDVVLTVIRPPATTDGSEAGRP